MPILEIIIILNCVTEPYSKTPPYFKHSHLKKLANGILLYLSGIIEG